jgi:hypothetical protein
MPRRKDTTDRPPADPFVRSSHNGAGKRGPGRPPVHEEEWTKATVVLFNRQIEFLDRVAANIRAHNGTAISRAQLIRAVVDAVAEANVDLTGARSEADMKATILSRLGRLRLSS